MTQQEQIEQIKQILIKTCKRCRSSEEDYMQSKYAEALCNARYRKESDTAREILTELLDMEAKAILNDTINHYECFYVSFDKFKKIAEKYGVDLGSSAV